MPEFKHLYGPVQSWRLGRSMGIDPISSRLKVCNMDCVYCQLGPTLQFESNRRVFIPTDDILREIRSMDEYEHFDFLTISGRGEPTLASNLGEIILGIKAIRPEPVAVITNSALMWHDDVRQALGYADAVFAKLDACDQASYEAVDQPECAYSFQDLLEGLWKFRREFSGHLSLDIMFTESNHHLAPSLAVLTKSLSPDEIHLNTPLRDCPCRPLTPGEMSSAASHFQGQPVATVYDKPVNPADWNDSSIIRRHGRARRIYHYS